MRGVARDPLPRGGPDEERTPAARLESLARELAAGDRGLWARAAALYLRAAELRGAGDAGAAEDLVVAGHLFYYAAEHDAALFAFRHAANVYLALGDIAAAARTLRDGAWVAHQAGLTLQARELGEWSQVLTRPQPQPQGGQRQLLFGAAPRS